MRLPNGYGSVVKLTGKRRRPYMVRITTGWTDDAKQIMAVLGYYHTKAEGLQALAEYNQKPIDLGTREMTFDDVYKAWSKHKFGTEEPERHYRGSYRWCEKLKNRPFKDLKAEDFQAAIDACPYGFSPKRAIKNLIGQMTKYAMTKDIVSKSYVDGVVLPKQGESGMHQPFTNKEIDLLLKMPKELNYCVPIILIYTGMRPSELLLIKKDDIDLENRTMRGGLKTKAGKNRIIPIAEKIVPYIEFLLALKEESPYLVPSPRSLTAMDYTWFRKSIWVPAMTKLGLDHKPHDGRHTCATLMDNADINAKIQKLILGHASTDITERVYTHKTIEQLKEAINKI